MIVPPRASICSTSVGKLRRARRRTRVGDPAVVDDDDGIADGRRAGAVDQLAVEDAG